MARNISNISSPFIYGRELISTQPDVYRYGSFAVAEVTLQNIAESDDEIYARYKHPHVKTCIPAYIEGREEVGVLLSNRVHIVSDYSPTNPGKATAFVGCCFGLRAEAPERLRAFIVAGGEETRSLDTLIMIDRKEYRSFDNVIFVGDSTTRIRGGQNANVEYPITRERQKRTRVPTSYDPLKTRAYQDVWIQTHFNTEGFQNCHIRALEFETNFKEAYVHGHFDFIESNIGAVVVNNGTDAPLAECFIEGVFVGSYDWDTPCYLHGFSEEYEGYSEAYMRGREALESSQLAEVNGPSISLDFCECFIMSVKSEFLTNNKAYMRGHVSRTDAQPGYINSHIAEEGNTLAFLNATRAETDVQLCFLQSENIYKARKVSYMRGRDNISGAQLLHIKAGTSVAGLQRIYMRSIDSAFRARRCFLNGESAQQFRVSQGCAISGAWARYSVNAFIVSKPLISVDCHIMSMGNISGTIRAVVAA